MRHPALLLLGALLTLPGCDQLNPKAAQPQEFKPDAKIMPPVNRFTIVHSPHIQRDTMLLDTATGETWQLVTSGKGDDSSLAWQKMDMADPLPSIDQPSNSN